ncbi:dihydrolipoyl dehydrogenase [Sporolactobacillus shoreicorticis]|uniref:Dihydrolipoyl dehydrogenase n=1 Tax=Sporolactobacillus shoreicorticis TaxID=1923877 RepID=A0ABW5S193_9BACL|nr:dihydrolipoyl dehydrogenase [Sporolactobacillus shoreicorticis]MCO7126797.1 dihydrolipoyl dehydrogenase [Sporolactobacillus shoreicorticis]
MAKNYDLVLLGGGTGGYVAAIRASQLGLKTAIVEKDALGGTCLHKGCIPTKALLRSAEVYDEIKKSSSFGIDVSEVALRFEKIQERKQAIVEKLHHGIQQLMKKGKIDVYNGLGRMLGPSIFSPLPGAISVEFADGRENEILISKNVILATGSRPRSLKGLDLDGKQVMTSDEALQMQECPASILIVGGGVIGVEWASMLADFGAQVTIVEYSNRIIPTEDKTLSITLARSLKKRGIKIVTSAKVLAESLKKTDEEVTISAEIGGQLETFTAEKMLVSVGRIPNTEDIGLANTSIETDHGYIKTNAFGQTKESHIYAIGDVIGGLQLAHVASHEGIKAVEHLAGLPVEPLHSELVVPRCIYTHPEIASIGLTEAQAKEQHVVKVGKVPFGAIGKALVYGDSEGFAKIVADKTTNDLLGIHIYGPHATDLIGEAAVAKLLDATPWELSEAIHPHPTLSEVIGEAALAADGRAIHI